MSVLDNFKKIAAIPRESGHEQGIREFITKWATEAGLNYKTDAAGNVVIYCPASKGMENLPATALQGHMDMVCVKRPGSTHDFAHDPIELVQKGDILHAKDTSMGADNGIAIAMMMDIFTDTKAKHGPLEGICTVNEEVGLSGAYGLEESLVHARKMINLDSEEEGVIYVGCAGGSDVKASFHKNREPLCECSKAISIEVTGLRSGHSGGEIHLQRANAIKIATRMLHQLGKNTDYQLISFDGGTKRNAIPAQAIVVFAVEGSRVENAMKELNEYSMAMKSENKVEEPDMKIIISQAKASPAFSSEDSRAFINSLFMAPHGVLAWSKTISGIVQTSCNLAIVRTDGDTISVETSQRSNVMSQRDAASERMALILATSGAETTIGEGYPSWDPNPDSALAKFCAKAWEEVSGKKPVITAIHAGLECGIINSKIPKMDSVSIGPDLKDVHTVNESMSISSAERICGFVKHLLSIIK
ncbi:MAG: aminoacyl-histidine dipeptidase [Sphaerochaetaceae bacterium]|jgi:dipeptidase D|nr:aminoacyl-histidine dipeptidase [Sphaerochaetaceae bacterium]NLY08044.1 aminoacyl-histidine dipeptidase [Spirochaetales bacterium]